MGHPLLAKNFHRGKVLRERHGVITKLADGEDKVVVFFGEQKSKNGQEKPVCIFTDKDANGTEPVPKEKEHNGKKGCEFVLPLTALREATPAWSFPRKLLGDEALTK